jgi:diguanylate cyclase (GGDEF)-like protein
MIIRNIYKQDLKDFAQREVTTLSKSINNDLLKIILNPTVDGFTDLTYRLSAFDVLQGLIIYDDKNKPIFKYKDTSNLEQNLLDKDIFYASNNLYAKQSISAEGYDFGHTLINISLLDLKKKQQENLIKIMSILPLALLIGFVISLFLSNSYTKPFNQLLKAMKDSDPTNNNNIFLKTDAQNEIKELFVGFNNLMKQISNSTKTLNFQATHDQLTGLFNRFYMAKKVNEALKDETNTPYALIKIDINQFKLINSTVGYQNGDQLLKMIALKLDKFNSKNGVVARIDGDNFMILLKNFSKEDGISFIKNELNFLNDFRFSTKSKSLSITANIALLPFIPFEYTTKEITRHIDTTMQMAKDKGINKFEVFNPNDDVSKRFNREIEVAGFIKEALKDGPSKFELFAQAIVPLQYNTEKISYEILIRMWDKNNNFVSPIDFLPTAERYQLMSKIDSFVLWSYLEIVTKSPEHIEKLHSVHINLAGSSLNNIDFQTKVKEAVNHFDFPWEKLELEVTETSAVGNFNNAKDFIAWLKSVGIGLALDDFGTGMSSFEYLKSLPFDVVKIDGSFVKDMHTDPTDKSVIKYIQEIASLKGQKTVAEYVETQKDVDELTKMGITYGQGYFLGKPQPLSSWIG